MIQIFTNKLLYNLFLITFIFAVILHDIIGFKSIDEICCLVLVIIFLYNVFHSKGWEINKAFFITLCIFAFYLCYSLWIGSNTKKAILMDLIIQMKPYLAFFCIYQLKPKFTPEQRSLLKQISLLFWFILLPLGIAGMVNLNAIFAVMKHPTYFAGAITAISLVYLYSSDYSRKDKIIFILMMTLGLVSGRSKFYGFYALSLFATIYFDNPRNLKINTKSILAAISVVFLIVFVAREKVMYYFGQGIAGEEMDYVARFVLYATSITLFIDYFPFGTGLASFATHASGYFYSPLYSKYNIDSVWGISKHEWGFIADTYYPSLAQFGIIGVALFATFWCYLLKKSYDIFKRNQQTKYILLTSLITGYCLIENIADASFTSNRGFFMLMFLGLIISDGQADNSLKENDTASIKK